jgi:hypothetical protein
MRQLQRLLEEQDPNTFSAAIYSIDKALLLDNATPIARTNLVLICGNDYPARGKHVPHVDWKQKPNEYKAPHDLQVVELFLSEGEKLIDEIYDCLWNGV